ncbi:HEAT repeat domain-containing protein, partial [bacterium]|nr:HEAT repeat domain-containing protein [candidate division CSSED10-310 bacterium]
ESILFEHFLDGSLGDKISEDVQYKLLGEIKRNKRSAGRQVIEHLKQEESYGYPIIPRDAIAWFGDKWLHYVGEIITKVLDLNTLSVEDPRVADLIEWLIPSSASIPPQRHGPDIVRLLSEMSEASSEKQTAIFVEYWEKLEKLLFESEGFMERIRSLVTELVEHGNSQTVDETGIIEEFEELVPKLLQFPSLNEKVFSVVYRLSNMRILHAMLIATLDNYAKLGEPNPETSAAFQSRLVNYCTNERYACNQLMVPIINNLFQTASESVSESLFEVVRRMLQYQCRNCEHLADCPVIAISVSHLNDDREHLARTSKLVQIWKDAAYALLIRHPTVFKEQVVPMAETPLNPEDYSVPELRDLLADAWQTFSEAPLFQDIFRNLVAEDRDIRFRTIKELAEYGAFAVWVCLGAMNSQNWHLRRNLATVLGKVTDLKHINLLRGALRDHDWHVRWEIIHALAERGEEIESEIQNNPDHPIARIFCMALRDGNKSIRQVALKAIEQYKLLTAVRSLQDLYGRLAAVNADADLDERVEIMKLLAKLTEIPGAPVDNIIAFISGIASQKEGLITPNWMVPIKKGAVEALAAIESPKSREWIKTLGTQRPHKRGVVGRIARSAMQKLNLQ